MKDGKPEEKDLYAAIQRVLTLEKELKDVIDKMNKLSGLEEKQSRIVRQIQNVKNEIAETENSLNKSQNQIEIVSKYKDIYTVTMNGTKYYLDSRAGSDGRELNEEICTELGLVCNRW